MKKGIFFTTDAIIALGIIFIVLLISYPLITQTKITNRIHQDILVSFSALKIGEVDNDYVKTLIQSGAITDTKKTILEQIGEFYITNVTRARLLTTSLLADLNTTENIGIWYGTTFIAAHNRTSFNNAKEVTVARQIISGIQEGENVTGYAARAFLSSSRQQKNIYFGGYVGDGNISLLFEINGNVSAAELEIAINNNFTMYINGNFAGNYNKSISEFTPIAYTLPENYLQYINDGINHVNFTGDNLYIAGGFLKISYESTVTYTQPQRYYFPGIEGIINIYDGVHIPSALQSVSALLHYKSSHDMFLTIGNTTIYLNASLTEATETIDNSYLSSILNYSSLENKTVPLRIGLQNLTNLPGRRAYIMSVADLSGGVSSARASGCGNDGLCAVQQANRVLVNSLLKINTTQVGLVGNWQGNVHPPYSHPLSTNETSLNKTITSWTNNGNLDLCFGIQNATSALNAVGTGDDLKIIVLLGTKYPNSCLGNAGNIYNDTYNLACQAWTNYNITVNTIGIIGNSQPDKNLNQLLYDIALCANGTYYNQSASNDLIQLYNNTANDIVNIIYVLQTSNVLGNVYSYLYPDSYIEFNHTSISSPYGFLISLESPFTNTYGGIFSIPTGASLLSATLVSYSGPKWTQTAKVNDVLIYNITEYGTDYVKIGDPYAISIPISSVNENNTVNITTAFKPDASFEGSSSNKIIYTVIKNISSYSAITSSATGCNWTVQLEDNSTLSMIIPEDYLGAEQCTYQNSGITYNSNDGIQSAANALFSLLDFDQDGRVDVELTVQDVQIGTAEVTGIPFPWSTEVQVRQWR